MKNPNSTQRRNIVRKLWPKQKGKCFYCNLDLINPDNFNLEEYRKPLNTKKKKNPENYPTLDHFVPKCFGGDWSLDNLVLACFACNHRKGDGIIPKELLADRKRLFKLFKSGQIKFHLLRSL